MSAKPRATVIMPSVAMKGGILNLEMSEPLMRPVSAPMPSATTMGMRTGTTKPGYLSVAESCNCARLVAITAASASTEPEPRSMPPVMMTIVTPMAISPMKEIWRTMLKRLRAVKKPSESSENARIIANRIRTMPYLPRKALTRSHRWFLSRVSPVALSAIP